MIAFGHLRPTVMRIPLRFALLPLPLAFAACARPADPLAALEAERPARPFAARVSIATAWRPCALATPDTALAAPTDPDHPTPGAGDDEVPRADCGAPASPSARVLAASERASALARETADPRALRAAGLMDLLWGGEGGISLDRSLSLLESAARLSERPAPALADLAAARLANAERTGRPRELVLAYEAAARALALDSTLAAARWNRALALDRLGLADEAATAWRDVAQSEPRSPWATEARARADALSREAPRPAPPASPAEAAAYAAADPQQALLLGWDNVLGDWGEMAMSGDTTGAAAALRMAEALGTALERRGGDASLADAVRAIGAAAGPRRPALARVHAAYARGRALYQAGDYQGAGPAFERLATDPAASAPLHAWALLYRGATRLYARRTAEAERDLGAVAAAADPARLPALAGRAHWSIGTALLRSGRYAAALAEYRAAEPLLARAGEREHLGAVQYLEGETWLALGDRDAGWARLRRATATLRPVRGSLWLHNLLKVAAEAAATDGLPPAALALQDADVNAATRTGQPLYRAEALLARARLRAVAGDGTGAAADLAAGDAAVRAMPPGPATFFRAQLRLAQAAAAARTSPARSAAALDSAVAFFAPEENPLHLLPALVARADARLALGDEQGAAADLDAATARLSALGQGVAGAAARAALLDAARGVFDRMVMLRVRQGRPADALAALERGRASLAGAAPGGSPGVVAPPRGQAALAYAVIGDTLLAWSVSAGGVRMARATVGQAALARLVERARSALELRADTAARAALAALYDRLVRPLQAGLGRDGATLVVAAEGEVAAVPFAALLDTARGRWLVEMHPLRFAPTLRDAARGARPLSPAPRALVVADPAFDAEAYPGLQRLPGAGAEARAVAALYPGARVLAGPAADRAAVAATLGRAEVVHFAGHALFDEARPSASALVLAPSAGAGGRLDADEIARLDLRGVRLVVLSACRTVRSGGGRSGGFEGLSGALLAAGVGGVVGSVGVVDDATTRALMPAFHQAFRATGDGPGALRAAQLRLLRSPDPALRSPSAWGAFRYTGA